MPAELTPETAQQWFGPYLEGELSADECGQLESLLENDDAVRCEFESFRGMLNSLEALQPARPASQFTSRVEQRIRRRSAGRFFDGSKPARRWPFEWFSLVIILALLTLYLFVVVDQNVVSRVGNELDGGPTESLGRPAN